MFCDISLLGTTFYFVIKLNSNETSERRSNLCKVRTKRNKLNWNVFHSSFALQSLKSPKATFTTVCDVSRVHWAVSNFRNIWSRRRGEKCRANIWAYNNNVVDAMMDGRKKVSCCEKNSLIRFWQDQQAFAFQKCLISDEISNAYQVKIGEKFTS